MLFSFCAFISLLGITSSKSEALFAPSNDSVVTVQGEVDDSGFITDSNRLPEVEDVMILSSPVAPLESDLEAVRSDGNQARLLKMIARHHISINDDTLPFLDTLFHQFQQFLDENENENDTEFQLVASSVLITTKAESESCRQILEQLQIQYQAVEKEKSLIEIRLKMVRNDLTVTKITGEQQKLSIDEQKVDLEHRIKVLQLENSRLQSELLQARKAATTVTNNQYRKQQSQAITFKCEGPPAGPSLSSFTALFSTVLPSTSQASAISEKVNEVSPPNEARNSTREDGSIMRTAKQLLPIIYTTINTVIPSTISFVVWEYRLAFRVIDVVKDRAMVVVNVSTIISSVLDTQSKDSYFVLMKNSYDREIAPSISSTVEAVEAMYKEYGLDTYLSPVWQLIITCLYSFMARLSQYYNEANDVYGVANWMWRDCEELFHLVGNFIAQHPIVAQALGDSSKIVSTGVLLIVLIVLLIKLRRVLIGLALLGIIVALLPLLITLYIGFRLLSFIWPKRKIKKVAKKGKKSILNQSSSGSQLMPVSQTSMGIGGRAALR